MFTSSRTKQVRSQQYNFIMELIMGKRPNVKICPGRAGSPYTQNLTFYSDLSFFCLPLKIFLCMSWPKLSESSNKN
jgi:hypothetical protein